MKELIDRIEKLIDAMGRPGIPVELDLWSSAEIAAYLKVSRRHASERVMCHPTFPKAIRVPSVAGGSIHPRWKAMEVIEWAEKHR